MKKPKLETQLETEKIKRRALDLLRVHQEHLHCRTDRLFAFLMALQWLASMAAAYWIAPRTWEGLSSRPHPHLWIALFLGGAISLFPIALAIWSPGSVLTRHVIAIGQMLMSGLLIHLTGGRLETHFHVFGSLAFLAFYRDWRVLATASLVTGADHCLRGLYWPQSIYGSAAIEPWHWMEHVGWVVFTDIFLFVSIAHSVHEMRDIAWRQAGQEAAEAGLQQAHDRLEMRVAERTTELAESNTALERDIAERRRSEEALRVSEQRHRSLMESLPDAMLVHCQGYIVYANPAALSLLEYAQAEDLLGRQTLSIIPSEFHSLARERIRSNQQGCSNSLVRLKFFRTDGAAIDVETISTPIVWQGQPGGQIVIRDIAERVASEQKLADLHHLLEQRLDRIVLLNYELAQAYDGTIEGWSKALDLRDHETEGHSQRVSEMTLALAEAFGVGAEELVHIRRGALLHDIGKMGVPDHILLKPGPLTDDEWVLMRRHPEYAYQMLSQVDFVRPALEIPYCHHEKWDGTGYPRGLRGEEIPLSARLFAIVDVWDALRSDRPYRRAWPLEKTCDHIAALAGTHFDPQVVEVFLRQVAPLPIHVAAEFVTTARVSLSAS